MKISWIQKAALVCFGFFLTAVVLEAGLRIGGAALSFVREHEARQALRQKNSYRILCIGESTTYRQYPRFLEKALNEKNPEKRFRVIDRGIAGTNTSAILANIESDLNEFRPDMVVAMMGINDFGGHMPRELSSPVGLPGFLKSLKIYKLVRFLCVYFKFWKKGGAQYSSGASLSDRDQSDVSDNRLKEAVFFRENEALQERELKRFVALNPGDSKAYVELGQLYRGGNLGKTIECFNKALESDPENDAVHMLLGECYIKCGKFDQAAQHFNDVLKRNPRSDDAYVGLGKAQWFQGAGWLKSEKYFAKALEINPRNSQVCVWFGRKYCFQSDFQLSEKYFKKAQEMKEPTDTDFFLGEMYFLWGKYSLAEAHFLKSLKLNKTSRSKVCGALAVIYEKTGRYALAEEYYEKASRVSFNEFGSLIAGNYHKLKAILDRRSIRLVCVQYPVRSVSHLKKIFEGQEDGIIFVDNERIFKDAIRKDGRKAYFNDMFAGDFGHCTEKGNRLLANNIADVIQKKVFSKSSVPLLFNVGLGPEAGEFFDAQIKRSQPDMRSKGS